MIIKVSCSCFEQKDSTCVARLLERGRGDFMSKNRVCGSVYYAAALPPLLNESTEVYLVHKVEDGSHIVVVPSARTDPADSVAVLL